MLPQTCLQVSGRWAVSALFPSQGDSWLCQVSHSSSLLNLKQIKQSCRFESVLECPPSRLASPGSIPSLVKGAPIKHLNISQGANEDGKIPRLMGHQEISVRSMVRYHYLSQDHEVVHWQGLAVTRNYRTLKEEIS